MLSIGDEGGVDHLRPVVELLVEHRPESKGICAGQDNLHGLDIGRFRCVLRHTKQYGSMLKKQAR